MTSASRFCRATLMLKAKAKTVTANMFQKHLLLTNLGISLSLTSAGDALQQYYVMLKSSDRSYNSRRTFNMGVAGSALGFIGHHYYNWIDKFLPGRTWLTVGKKVIIDQLVCSPIMIGVFLLTLSIIEGNSLPEFLVKASDKSWRLYIADWMVWPIAQTINYSVLPTRFRVLYDSTVSLGYDILTSYIYNELSLPPDDA